MSKKVKRIANINVNSPRAMEQKALRRLIQTTEWKDMTDEEKNMVIRYLIRYTGII